MTFTKIPNMKFHIWQAEIIPTILSNSDSMFQATPLRRLVSFSLILQLLQSTYQWQISLKIDLKDLHRCPHKHIWQRDKTCCLQLLESQWVWYKTILVRKNVTNLLRLPIQNSMPKSKISKKVGQHWCVPILACLTWMELEVYSQIQNKHQMMDKNSVSTANKLLI